MLVPLPTEELEAYPLSTIVNSPADGPPEYIRTIARAWMRACDWLSSAVPTHSSSGSLVPVLACN
jgi:hypothetical protein